MSNNGLRLPREDECARHIPPKIERGVWLERGKGKEKEKERESLKRLPEKNNPPLPTETHFVKRNGRYGCTYI